MKKKFILTTGNLVFILTILLIPQLVFYSPVTIGENNAWNPSGTLFAQEANPAEIEELTFTGKLPSGSSLWSQGSKIRVNDELVLSRYDTLIIQPGVRIELGSSATITIKGTLIARGTSDSLILFTRADKDSAWGRLMFTSSSSADYDENGNYTGGSILEYAVMDGGGAFSLGYSEGMLLCTTGSPYLHEIELFGGEAQNGGGMALVNGAKPKIERCSLHDNLAQGNGGGIYVSMNADALLINNLIYNNKAERDGGGIFISYSPARVERNVIDNNQAGRDGGALSMSGSTPSVFKSVFRNNTAAGEGDNIVVRGGCEPTIQGNAFIHEEDKTAMVTQGGGGSGSKPVNAVQNYWGSSDPVKISKSRIDNMYDANRPAINFEPILEAPLDDIALQVTQVDCVFLFEDPQCSVVLQTDYIGYETPLYICAMGQGSNRLVADWLLVDLIASNGDRVRAILTETGANTNDFRVMALTSKARKPDHATVHALIGESLTFEPVGFPELAFEKPILRQKPYVKNPVLIGVKDLKHLIDDQVVAQWVFQEPKLRTQKKLKITVLDDAGSGYWSSGEIESKANMYPYQGGKFTHGKDFTFRIELTNGIAWSEPADIPFHRNSIPQIPTLVYPYPSQVLLTQLPALTLRSEMDTEGDDLKGIVQLVEEETPGRILQGSNWLPIKGSGKAIEEDIQEVSTEEVAAEEDPVSTGEIIHETLELMKADSIRVPERSRHIRANPIDKNKYSLISNWSLTTPLDDNTVYLARAKTTDSWETTNYSDWLRFIVNLSNDTPGDFSIEWPGEHDEILPSDRIYWSIPPDPDPEDILTYTITLGEAGAVTRENGVIASDMERIGLLVDDAEVTLTVIVNDLEDSVNVAADSARLVYYNAVNDTPTVPIDLSIADSQLVRLFPARLTWSASTDEDHSDPSSSLVYEVDINRIWGEDLTVLRSAPGETEMALNPVEDNMMATWRIRAIDDLETPSAWTSPRLLEVNARNDTPSVPTGFSLSDNQIVRDIPAVLSWKPSTDVDESDPAQTMIYEIELLRGNKSPLEILRTGKGKADMVLNPVEDNMLAHWRVRSIDDENLASRWSTFTLLEVNRVNDMPTVPMGFSLSDSQRIRQYPSPLSWQASTDIDESDPCKCLVYEIDLKLEDGSAITVLRTAPGKINQMLDPVPDNSRAVWRVRAIDDEAGASGWSKPSILEVNVRDEPPNPFELSEPSDNSTPYSLGPTIFRWVDAIDPDPLNTIEYDFMLSKSPQFGQGDIISEETTSNPYVTHSEDLEHLVDYYWRVKAKDNTGLDTWSKTYSFKVVSTPSIPTWAEKLPMEILPGYAFKWNASSDPDPSHSPDVLEYRMEISSDKYFTPEMTVAKDKIRGTQVILS
ncbi:MAG: right-handed parallel beta-helix repeat-containing protein, partial [Candidatus Electryonea clarkiae]|nr:right-handed parallel beta-helix repeat-containing protein [Candidatus Electryonea clarkiae]